jgi:hypothetical protein
MGHVLVGGEIVRVVEDWVYLAMYSELSEDFWRGLLPWMLSMSLK